MYVKKETALTQRVELNRLNVDAGVHAKFVHDLWIVSSEEEFGDEVFVEALARPRRQFDFGYCEGRSNDAFPDVIEVHHDLVETIDPGLYRLGLPALKCVPDPNAKIEAEEESGKV